MTSRGRARHGQVRDSTRRWSGEGLASLTRLAVQDPYKHLVAVRVLRALLPAGHRPRTPAVPADITMIRTEMISALVTEVRITDTGGRTRTFLVKVHEISNPDPEPPAGGKP